MQSESEQDVDRGCGERSVIIHADDIGMCHGANAAFEALLPVGIMTSASVMVPCPWFLEAADICRRWPDADVGVNITLTSEWRTYRWGAISTRSASSGLLDDEGYLPRSVDELYRQMNPDAAIQEMRAQVEHALELGLGITHIDTHMGAVMHPLLLPGYAQPAIDFGVPVMLPRPEPEQVKAHRVPAEAVLVAQQQRRRLKDLGIALIDHVRGGPVYATGVVDDSCRALEHLPPGTAHLYFHPSSEDNEIKAITPQWRTRVADYEAATSNEVSDRIAKMDIQLVGHRQLAARFDA